LKFFNGLCGEVRDFEALHKKSDQSANGAKYNSRGKREARRPWVTNKQPM